MTKMYIKRTSEHALIPTKSHNSDAGFDIYTSQECIIQPHDFKDVLSDIYIAMPSNIWGRICGRSSTIRNWRCMVIEGIIDTGYRGQLHVGIWNVSPKLVTIPVGIRIGQIIFHEHIKDQIIWTEVDELPESTRGPKGFGSSGL